MPICRTYLEKRCLRFVFFFPMFLLLTSETGKESWWLGLKSFTWLSTGCRHLASLKADLHFVSAANFQSLETLSFLGPRGHLIVPSFARPRQKSKSPLKSLKSSNDHRGWCTGGDAPNVMRRMWCTRGDAPWMVHRGWWRPDQTILYNSRVSTSLSRTFLELAFLFSWYDTPWWRGRSRRWTVPKQSASSGHFRQIR